MERTTHLTEDGTTGTHCELTWADLEHLGDLTTDATTPETIGYADCETCLNDLHHRSRFLELADAAAERLANLGADD